MKTKKILSVIMAVAAVFSCSFSAFASGIEADYEIKAGETIEVSVPAFDGETFTYVKFVPEKSGAYMLSSDSKNSDPACELLDSDGEILNYNDDLCFEENFNFELIFSFTAGETYWFSLHEFASDADASWSITLKEATHTAADGSEHSVEYKEWKDSACNEAGYTEGLYCPICEETVYGCEEIPASHTDWDFDGICDDCLTEFCSCICHSKNPVVRMIWNIISFFRAVFGNFHICECIIDMI